MNTPSTLVPSNPVPYLVRVFTSDSTKKGAAAAIAGVLVAAVAEALWPST